MAVRAPLTKVERGSAAAAVVAAIGYAIYGFAVGATSVPVYVGSVFVLGGAVLWARRRPLSPALAIGLAVQAIANLTGGLLQVGDSVFYEVHVGPSSPALNTYVLQVDHPVHAFGTFVGTLALWELIVPPMVQRDRPGAMVLLCVIGGLGIGAVNEALEFVATVAHHGGHVGGYFNTGWDLVSNTIGATAAAVWISLRPNEPADAS